MPLKDKQYLANIVSRISASVTTVNEKIVADQQGKASAEELLTAVALQQLANLPVRTKNTPTCLME
jgi:hypothetical protein